WVYQKSDRHAIPRGENYFLRSWGKLEGVAVAYAQVQSLDFSNLLFDRKGRVRESNNVNKEKVCIHAARLEAISDTPAVKFTQFLVGDKARREVWRIGFNKRTFLDNRLLA